MTDRFDEMARELCREYERGYQRGSPYGAAYCRRNPSEDEIAATLRSVDALRVKTAVEEAVAEYQESNAIMSQAYESRVNELAERVKLLEATLIRYRDTWDHFPGCPAPIKASGQTGQWLGDCIPSCEQARAALAGKKG